jgi:hypothetical protein
MIKAIQRQMILPLRLLYKIIAHIIESGECCAPYIELSSPDTQVDEDAPHPAHFGTHSCHLFDKQSDQNLIV